MTLVDGCRVPVVARTSTPRRWGELLVQSNHTFLGGASHPEELVRKAAQFGHAGIALADACTVGGAVRAHVAAAELRRAGTDFHLAHGARMRFAIDQGAAHEREGDRSHLHPSGTLEIALYASSRASWGLLCRLLSDTGVAYSGEATHSEVMVSRDARQCHPSGNAIGRDRHGAAPRPLHDLVHLLHEHPGGRDLLGVMLAPSVPDQGFLEAAEGLTRIMGGRESRGKDDRLAIAMHRVDDHDGVIRAERAALLADALGVPVVASGDIRMHEASRRPMLDTLTCIKAGIPIQRARHLVSANAERRLRSAAESCIRYGDRPDALDAAWRFLERASAFSLDELRYEYPDEVVPPEYAARGCSAMEYLKLLVWRGARERYPRGIPQKVARQIEHEFAIIADLAYAPYFLTVHEIVAFARGRGILCQGRGAAANSAVCFALGITAVDPDRVDVLFERFVSRERNEPPDIDIDFEHERREEVIQHIYAKYGRDRAALVCEIISYRGRSAVRDVGKALGIAHDAVERLAREVDRWGGGGLGTRDDLTESAKQGGAQPMHDALPPASAERMRAAGLDPTAPLVIRYAQLVDGILGFPRHRSQHVGGFVISRQPLVETVPVLAAAMQDRTIIEWDKDDIEALGMLKIDVLSLGMLTAIRKAMDLVNADRDAIALGASPFRPPDAPAVRTDRAAFVPESLRSGAATGPPPASERLRLHSIPAEDPAVYDMVSAADTVGVFQIESRAQMSMLPRLRPRCFYDLVIEVAIVRPGPIQGDMVHPYLRRRNGEEPTVYPDDAIRKVLGKTLGVPLFQEQAMALAVVAAGFTPGQADELRRAIAAWKRQGNRIAQFGEALEEGMAARGYSRIFARQVFEQVKGFSGYGFPESHAASFALLVYASAWLKRHHPAAFAAALLNSQPMGFYAPAQIIGDARDHGVAVREVDIHCSQWDATLERGSDLARRLAGEAPLFGEAVHTRPTGSCRRTQREIEDAALRLRVRHPIARIGVNRTTSSADGVCVEVFEPPGTMEGSPRWREPEPVAMSDQASDSFRSSTDGAAQLDPKHSTHPAVRLHARGRSVRFGGEHAVPPEPLCASSSDALEEPHAFTRFHVPAQPAIRLGLRMVRGLDVEDAHRMIDAVRRHGVFRSISDLHEASGVGTAALRRLAAADAFTSMGLDRQQASWQILALRDRSRPLWSFAETSAASGSAPDNPRIPSAQANDREANLPPIEELSGIARDFEATGVSLKRHPIACIRPRLTRACVVPCAWLRDAARTPAGRILSVAGLVLVRQRPSTAKGVVFMTLEDESGIANLIFRPKVYERLRGEVRHAAVLCVRGKVERRDGVAHLLVANARDIAATLARQGVGPPSRDFH